MRRISIKIRLASILAVLMLLPAMAFADLGSFSGDTDYSYDSAYESSYQEEYYEEEYDSIETVSAEDASLSDMLGSLAIILVTGGIIAGIVIFSCWVKKRIREKKEEEMPPKQQLEDILLYTENVDPAFDRAAFEQKAADLYMQFQHCWTQGNIESLRMYFEESLFARLERQLAELRRKGHVNYVERISVINTGVLGYYQTKQEDRIPLMLSARITDYTVNAAGKVISGSNKEKFMVYEWEFARAKGRITGESGMSLSNCPNCGAPLNVNQSAKCPYCGTIVEADEHDWLITSMRGRIQRTGR